MLISFCANMEEEGEEREEGYTYRCEWGILHLSLRKRISYEPLRVDGEVEDIPIAQS